MEALKTQGKINVENSVENVDNSLNSRAEGHIYVKQKCGFIDETEKEKRLKNGAFFDSVRHRKRSNDYAWDGGYTARNRFRKENH